MGTLQSGRLTDTQSRAEPSQRPGTGTKSGAGILGGKQLAPGTGLSLQRQRDLTLTLSGPILLRSKRRLAGSAAPEKLLLSGDGFHVNGSLNRRCVVALLPH